MSLEIRQMDPRSELGMKVFKGSSDEQIRRYGRDGGRTADELTGDGAVFVVALLDGQPVGCGAVVALEAGTGELSRIFVDESARRRGAGSAIMKWLEDYAREKFDRLVLETGTAQEESIALYEALGYTPIRCWGKSEHNPLSRCYEKRLK